MASTNFIVIGLILILESSNSVERTSRTLPEWFDKAKFGIMIHWGVYSVPSFGGGGASEWFWKHWKDYKQKPLIEFMAANYKPGFGYADFAPYFTAEFFNPDEWVDILKATGAQYVVLTSKHHDGFCLWPTNVSFSWRSVDVGPNRDLLGDFANSLRKRSGMRLGIYHSLYEWFNQLYIEDKSNNYTTRLFSMGKTIPELYELVTNYKPSLIWSDGEWEAGADYWGSQEFIDWLYTLSPVKDEVVVNNRWGANGSGPSGDYQSYENQHRIIYKQKEKWENAVTFDQKSWGYRREAQLQDYLTPQQIIRLLIQAVSMGGNFLLNISPTADGIITPHTQEVLKMIGLWVNVNSEAIFNTTTWEYQIDEFNSDFWYTKYRESSTNSTVYGFLIDSWPDSYILELSSPKPSSSTKITLLGYRQDLEYSYNGTHLLIHLPYLSPNSLNYAWTFRFKNILNA